MAARLAAGLLLWLCSGCAWASRGAEERDGRELSVAPRRPRTELERAVRLERRRQRDGGGGSRCEVEGWSIEPRCRRTLPCDLRAYDPGASFHRDVIDKSRPREWAKNNVDAPNRFFQNGIEWWLHRALPPATSNVSALEGAQRVFVTAYFSYMCALRCLLSLTGPPTLPMVWGASVLGT